MIVIARKNLRLLNNSRKLKKFDYLLQEEKEAISDQEVLPRLIRVPVS